VGGEGWGGLGEEIIVEVDFVEQQAVAVAQILVDYLATNDYAGGG
jgi:hypothetical protein